MKNAKMLYLLKKQSSIKMCMEIVVGILAIIKVFLYILNKYFNIYFLAGNVHQKIVEYWLNIFIIIITIILIALFVRRVWLKVIIVIVGTVTLLLNSFLFRFGDTDKKYFYFSSPDNINTIIVEENSWLLGGWSNFYLKRNSLFVKDIKAQIRTDDGYRPFTRGDYNLSWIDDKTIKLIYGFGGSDIIKTEIIKLE